MGRGVSWPAVHVSNGARRTDTEHTPGLAGKIAIRFVIEAGGVVGSAATASSTMASPAVESCLVERIQTWAFPAPKGGGKVVVTYPFIFRRPAK